MSKSDKLDKLNSDLTDMSRAAFDVTRDWLSMWRDGLNYIYHNQLEGHERRQGYDRIQINLIYPTVQQEMALIMQRKPIIIARPQEESDIEAARMMEKHHQWLWKNQLRMNWFLANAVLDQKIFGYSIWKSYWEPKAYWDEDEQRWVGQVRRALIHPQNFAVDPEATSLDDAGYVVCRTQRTVDDVVRRYPKFADEIKAAARMAGQDRSVNAALQGAADYGLRDTADPSDSTQYDEEAMSSAALDAGEGRLAGLLRGHSSDRQPAMMTDPQTHEQTPRYVWVEEIYFRDDSETHEKIEEKVPADELEASGEAVRGPSLMMFRPNGEPYPTDEWPTRVVREYDRPLYPYGRYVIRVGVPGTEAKNWVILNPKEEDQRWGYKRWPYVTCVNSVLPHSWQGENTVEPSRHLQDWANTTATHMTNYVRNFGDPVERIEAGALVGDNDGEGIIKFMMNRAGRILKFKSNKLDRYTRDEAPQMPMGPMSFFQLMYEHSQNQTGMQDIGLGQKTPGEETATAASNRLQNTQMRVNMQIHLLDMAIVEFWKRVDEIVADNYEPGQIIRVVNKKHAPTVMAYTQELADAAYDIDLDVGLATPHDREREQEKWMGLFELLSGIGAGEAVLPNLLRSFEVEDIEEILQRVPVFQEANRMLIARQEQQQQQETAV